MKKCSYRGRRDLGVVAYQWLFFFFFFFQSGSVGPARNGAAPGKKFSRVNNQYLDGILRTVFWSGSRLSATDVNCVDMG